MQLFIQAIVVSAAFLAADAPTKASPAIAEGNAFFESEDFARALTAYQRAVELEPKLALARFLLARTHERMLEPPAFFSEAEENPKAAAEARALQAHHRAQAVTGYHEALDAGLAAAESIDYRAAARKALIQLELGASGREEAALEQATLLARENPGDPRALTVLATTLEKVGRVAQAEATFREMTRAAPRDREACEAFAAFYMRPNWNTRSKYAQGLDVAGQCAELTPTDPRAHLNAAASYWSVAFRAADLSDAEVGRLADLGLKAIARALALDAEYIDALSYKELLLRLKVRVATNPLIRSQLADEARAARDLAGELKRKRTSPQE